MTTDIMTTYTSASLLTAMNINSTDFPSEIYSKVPLALQNLIDVQKSCREYYQNSTGFIIKDYEGIPENLLVNVCAWFFLLIVFTFLRKIGDYGRFGLIKSDEEKRLLEKTTVRYDVYSASIFQKKNDPEETQSINAISGSINRDNDEQMSEVSSGGSLDNQKPIINEEGSTASLTQEIGPHSEKYKDKYFFSWIIHMYTLKDAHIKEKSGKDALYYLIFQRYLIGFLVIVTCASLIILLPINILSGYIISEDPIFGKTTITNVDPNSSVLWTHLVLSWVFLIIGVVMVKIFSKKMKYDEGEYVSRTVLITNYPINQCDVEQVRLHFEEAYPDLNITDIQFAYDIRKLGKLTKKKRTMECGRILSQKQYENTGDRPTMHPFHFGSFFECCCCFCEGCLKEKNKKNTDAIEFYTKNENDLIVKIAEYKEMVLKNPLGILFVTFETQEMAAKFHKDYHLGFLAGFFRSQFNDKGKCLSCYICKNLAKNSSLSDKLNSDMWNVKYATSPNNIIWENVSKYGLIWWFRVFLINIVLFILMIFFTTPSILLDKVSSWGSITDVTTQVQKLFPVYLKEVLPSLMLRLLAALLPVLVALTALAELHWTRSSRNRSMMVKTYLLLLFMTLILPTLGLTSINALFQWFNDDSSNIKWQCVSENGAFFIKYVTTFALIGTALDLLRLPDLALYLIKMVWSRNAIERHDVRQQVALEFNFGVEYAWILAMFTVTLSFSVVCPLITPFGLLYMVLKHLVDRYNLYFGYIPTKVDKRIHKTAVTFAIGSFIMLQFCILFFIAIRNKGNINSNYMTIIQTLIIVISCILFIGRLFFGFFKRISPFHKHSGSSCQASNDLEQDRQNAENDEFEEVYNKLDQSTDTIDQIDENGNVQVDQPESATKKKHKHRHIFRHKRSKKKYEIFQSPFVPSLLRSSDYQNISSKNDRKVKGISVNSSERNTVINLNGLDNDNDNESSTDVHLTTNKILNNSATESQVDLLFNTSSESNSSKPTTSKRHSGVWAINELINNIRGDKKQLNKTESRDELMLNVSMNSESDFSPRQSMSLSEKSLKKHSPLGDLKEQGMDDINKVNKETLVSESQIDLMLNTTNELLDHSTGSKTSFNNLNELILPVFSKNNESNIRNDSQMGLANVAFQDESPEEEIDH